MNRKIVIKECGDCQYCDHNGMYQSRPKYVCNHSLVMKKSSKDEPKADTKYSHLNPIICSVGQHNKEIKIPDWCPLEVDNE